MQVIEGRMIINVMRGCLSEVSTTLRGMRGRCTETDQYEPLRNGLLFSLDMNLAVIHLLGIKLMEAESLGRAELTGSERVVLGMAGSFMSEPVAQLIEDALEGLNVSDERVNQIVSANRHQQS
ncbi:hypothetical protein [Acidihalobacter prosperus]